MSRKRFETVSCEFGLEERRERLKGKHDKWRMVPLRGDWATSLWQWQAVRLWLLLHRDAVQRQRCRPTPQSSCEAGAESTGPGGQRCRPQVRSGLVQLHAASCTVCIASAGSFIRLKIRIRLLITSWECKLFIPGVRPRPLRSDLL